MKFELEPYRRNIPDETFLDDLRKVANQLRKKSVTIEEYDKYGTYHSSSLRNRFGSWFIALNKAGLENARSEINIPVEKLIADLKRVAHNLKKDTVTRDEYTEHGQYAPSTLISHFGSWRSALEQNGLKRSRTYRVAEEIYFENLEYVWRTLGRQPRYSDMQKPLSKYSAKSYEQKFGTWRKALEAFVQYINREQDSAESLNPEPKKEVSLSQSKTIALDSSSSKAPRKISWRLRFLVMRRDNFKCCICGRSPALQPGLILHVDHRQAWAKGGSTVIDNLQTLCDQCNIGKSHLSMTKDDSAGSIRQQNPEE